MDWVLFVAGAVLCVVFYYLFLYFRCCFCRWLIWRSVRFRSWVCRRWLLRAIAYYSKHKGFGLGLCDVLGKVFPSCLCPLGVCTVSLSAHNRVSFEILFTRYALGFDFNLLMRDAPLGVRPRGGVSAGDFWWDFGVRGCASRLKCLRYLLSREEWVSFGNGR